MLTRRPLTRYAYPNQGVADTGSGANRLRIQQIPVDTDIPILLASTFDDMKGSDIEGPALVLVPDASGWNDFQNNFQVALHFVGYPAKIPELSTRVMFPGAARTARKVAELLGDQTSMDVDDVDEPFVSLLADTVAYRALVESLGFADAFASLRRMHDLVVAALEEDNDTLALADGLDFTQSMLRVDATWAALRQGGRYLTPHGAPDVDDAAHSFTVDVHLEGLAGRHALDADFGNEFPLSRRALVLVGENGIGKTRLFDAMIQGLQTAPDWEGEALRHREIFAPRPQFSRLLVFTSAPSDPYPASVPPWRGLDYRLHRMAGYAIGQRDNLAQSLLDIYRSDDTVEGLRRPNAIGVLEAMLEPLGIKDDLHVEVRPLDGGDTRPRPTRVGGRLYTPFFRAAGEQQRLKLQASMVLDAPPQVVLGPERARALSSGELVLLRFATQAIGSLRPGTMFLFDEPETHLHPHYVSLFMSMLDVLLELSGSVALIATHSAYIVREVPSRRVRIARKESDGAVSIDPPRMQTYGASIDMISQFVFGDVSTTHRFQTVLDHWLAEHPGATLNQFRERFGTDLNVETLSYVAQRLEEQRIT